MQLHAFLNSSLYKIQTLASLYRHPLARTYVRRTAVVSIKHDALWEGNSYIKFGKTKQFRQPAKWDTLML